MRFGKCETYVRSEDAFQVVSCALWAGVTLKVLFVSRGNLPKVNKGAVVAGFVTSVAGNVEMDGGIGYPNQ
jgi:hypothetical protein